MDRIYFITNRDPQFDGNADAPTGFGRDFNTAPYLLRYGSVKLPLKGAKTKITTFPEDMTAQPPVLGSDTFYGELAEAASEYDFVVYIHGFDTPFSDALKSVAQLQENWNAMRDKMEKKKMPVPRPLQFILFTWPSDGGPPTTYWNDLRDAQASGGAVAAALDRFRRFRVENAKAGADGCAARVHLMAQSMGNYVLRCGFQVFREMMGGAGGTAPPLFDQIILTAADEDADTFADPGKLMHLPEMASGVTVYYNPTDPVVKVSSMIRLGGRRLGLHGPSDGSHLDHVDVVNVFYVMPSMGSTPNDDVQHYYGRLHPRVHLDALQVLAGLSGDTVAGRTLRKEHRYVLDNAWKSPVPIELPQELVAKGLATHNA